MDRPVLSRGRGAAGGFTLVETMLAMAVTIVVMLANLLLFNTANRNLAAARAFTEATNLATRTIAGFRAMTVEEIRAAAPTVQASPNPLNVQTGSDSVTSGELSFSRSWTVSSVDVDGDGAADLAGDLVKVRVEIAWTAAGRGHQVSMATLTTGRAP